MDIVIMGALVISSMFAIALPIVIKKRVHDCKTPIEAECVAIRGYASTKGQKSYVPVFRYVYEGNEYEVQSPLMYSKKTIMKYTTGQQYTIYIDPEHPKKCIDSKKISGWYFFSGVVGVLMIALCICWMLER